MLRIVNVYFKLFERLNSVCAKMSNPFQEFKSYSTNLINGRDYFSSWQYFVQLAFGEIRNTD